MAMLAEPRRRKTYNLVPRGKALYHDEDRFGSKLLAKMGWTKGKGLGPNETGAVDFVRVRYKNDCDGLGYEERDDQWTQHADDYNGLLEKLNGQEVDESHQQNNGHTSDHDANEADARPAFGFGFVQSEPKPEKTKTKLKEKLSGESLEEKSMRSRARVHYQKFTRGKDLARYSEKDLANIFGKKANEAEEEAKPAEHVVWAGAAIKDESVQKHPMVIETGISVNDYFKQKMEALKNRKQLAGAANDYKGDDAETQGDDEQHKSLKRQNSEESEKENTNEDDSVDEVSKKKKKKLENGVENEDDEVHIADASAKKKKKKSKSKEEPEFQQEVNVETEEIPSKNKKNKKHKREREEDEKVSVDDNVDEDVADNITEQTVVEKQKKKKSRHRESEDHSLDAVTLEETPALTEHSEESKKNKKKKKSKERQEEPENVQEECHKANVEENEAVINIEDEGEEPAKKKKKKKSKNRELESSNEQRDSMQMNYKMEANDVGQELTENCEEPPKKKKKKSKDRQRELTDGQQESQKENEEEAIVDGNMEQSKKKKKKKSKESPENSSDNEVQVATEENPKELSKKKKKKSKERTEKQNGEVPEIDEGSAKKKESKVQDSDRDSDEQAKEGNATNAVVPADGLNDDDGDSSDYVSDDGLTKIPENSAELQELIDELKTINVFRISSIKADVFAMLNLDVFKGSTLPDIPGYGLRENLKLEIFYQPTPGNKVLTIQNHRLKNDRKIRDTIIRFTKVERYKTAEMRRAARRLKKEANDPTKKAEEQTAEIASDNVQEETTKTIKPLEQPNTADANTQHEEHSPSKTNDTINTSETSQTNQTTQEKNPKQKHEKHKMTKSELKQQQKQLKRVQNRKRRLQQKQRSRNIFTGF